MNLQITKKNLDVYEKKQIISIVAVKEALNSIQKRICSLKHEYTLVHFYKSMHKMQSDGSHFIKSTS